MPKTLEVTKSLALADLKDLANTQGPCVTVFMPLEGSPNTTRIDLVRLKGLIKTAEQELVERGAPEALVRELTESLRGLTNESVSGGESGSLVILRSPDVFRVVHVPERLSERVSVGGSPYVFPLIHRLQLAEQVFYLLALSQNHVRLLRCTETSAEQVELGKDVPVSLEEWLNTRAPNSAPEHGTVRESDTGSTGGSFTSTQDRDNKDEHIANFFRVVNKAVFDKLRDQRYPLVLCGVEYMRSLYKGVNTYQYILEEGVQGSPESLKGGEMQARAWKCAEEFFAGPAKKALALWERVAGSERSSTSFADIVKAAHETRVASLFAADNAQTLGVFDRETMSMKVQGHQEDLVNAAALQTFAFGGDVFVVRPEHVPGGGQMAAILRF